MRGKTRQRILICLGAFLVALSSTALPFVAADTQENPAEAASSGVSAGSGASETGKPAWTEELGSIVIGEGESLEFTTVSSAFGNYPGLPDYYYPGDLTVELTGPIVIENGGELRIGTLSVGGSMEKSPVLRGTLSDEPLIVVKEGGKLSLLTVAPELEGEGLLIQQEAGGVVKLLSMELDSSLVSWGPAVVDNSDLALEDIWIREGEVLTEELLPQKMNADVLFQGEESERTLSLRWDLSPAEGRTSGEAVLTGKFLDESGEVLSSRFPLTVTVHWYSADLLVTRAVWQGKDVPSVLLTVPNLPTDDSVEVWGEVSADGGETWEQWNSEERFFIMEDSDGAPVCVFCPPDDEPRLYRVCAKDLRVEERVWSSDSFLLPEEDDEREDQGGNRGGSMTLHPLERAPASSAPSGEMPASSAASSEPPQESAPASSAAAPASSAPSAPESRPSAAQREEIAPGPAEDRTNAHSSPPQPGDLAETGASSAQPGGEETPSAPPSEAPRSVQPAEEAGTSSAPPAEETAAAAEEQAENALSPAVQALLVLAGLAVCAVIGLAVAGVGPFRRSR